MNIVSKKELEKRYKDKEDEFMKELGKQASNVTTKKLEKYEKEYHKEELTKAKEKGEVEVLRRKTADLEEQNRQLLAKVASLDEETKALAEKLLSKSVMLNETEERLETTEELLRDRYESEVARKGLAKDVACQVTESALVATSGGEATARIDSDELITRGALSFTVSDIDGEGWAEEQAAVANAKRSAPPSPATTSDAPF